MGRALGQDTSIGGTTVNEGILQGQAAAKDSTAVDLGVTWAIRDNPDLVLAYNATLSNDRTQLPGCRA